MQTQRSKDIRHHLQSLKNLQTQPAVVAKITQMMQNPVTNADELGKAIMADQVLTSTILKLVNSAFYGFPGKIGSISHAIVLLGFATVKNIVITASVLEMFKTSADSERFNAQELWKHSLACGITAQCLAQMTGHGQKEECFVAGLLHDIGKVALFQLAPDDFMRVIECAEKTKSLFYDSEHKLISINHQEIGGILMEQWRLPPRIQKAVALHHSPQNVSGGDAQLAAIVHCADILARALKYGSGGDGKIPMVNDKAWECIELDKIDLMRLFDSIDTEWEKANVYFQLL
jgi:putative nucleotidyltransferase with HDIG domain